METLIYSLLAASALGAAMLLIARLRRADRELRAMRLTVLGMRSHLMAEHLNATLLAENTRLVAKGIDQGTLLVQGGHRAITEATFSLLELFPSTRPHAALARETHNLITTGLFGAVREINRQLTTKVAEKQERAPAQKKESALRRAAKRPLRRRVQGKKRA